MNKILLVEILIAFCRKENIKSQMWDNLLILLCAKVIKNQNGINRNVGKEFSKVN